MEAIILRGVETQTDDLPLTREHLLDLGEVKRNGSFLENMVIKNNKKISLAVQALTTKELQSYLQTYFKLFEIEVTALESATSRRLRQMVAPVRYCEDVSARGHKTFLDDVYKCGDILIEDTDKVSWSNTKVKVKLKEDSQYYTKDKVYSIGNVPTGVKIRFKKDGKYLFDKPIFTIPGVDIHSKTKETIYKNLAIGGKFRSLPELNTKDYILGNTYKVLDLNYIISICSILEESYLHLDINPTLLYNSNCSYYGNKYTSKDMKRLSNLRFLTKGSVEIPDRVEALIEDCSIIVSNKNLDKVLSERNLLSKRASYIGFNLETIPFDSDILSEYFNSIQMEADIDIEQIRDMENEFLLLCENLNLNRFIKKEIDIVFCKNKKGFYPHNNTLMVDIENQSSFISNLAHVIEENLDLKSIVAKDEFIPIAVKCKEANHNAGITMEFTNKQQFAICLDIYLSFLKSMESNFLLTASSLIHNRIYPSLSLDLLTEIKKYFDNIFNFEDGVNIKGVNARNILLGFANEQVGAESDIAQLIDSEEGDITTINISDNGAGTNFIFDIIKDSTLDSNIIVRPRARKRSRLNKAIGEDCRASQTNLF